MWSVALQSKVEAVQRALEVAQNAEDWLALRGKLLELLAAIRSEDQASAHAAAALRAGDDLERAVSKYLGFELGATAGPVYVSDVRRLANRYRAARRACA